MEKVFAGAKRNEQKFDIKQLSDSTGSGAAETTKLKSKYTDDDYECKLINLFLFFFILSLAIYTVRLTAI